MDSLQLQQLVDGECNSEQIRTMLAAANENPEHWREIASAFVEDKIWQSKFQGTESGLTQKADENPLLSNSPVTSAAPTKPEKQTPQSTNSRSIKLPTWLAMAAGLMLAATFGFIAGKDQASTSAIPQFPVAKDVLPPANNGNAGNLIANNNDSAPKMTPASASYSMKLVDENGNREDNALYNREIPLYLVESKEQMDQVAERNREQMQLPPELMTVLSERGAQMRQDFVSGSLRDGRTFVIPVRTIKFSSGQ